RPWQQQAVSAMGDWVDGPFLVAAAPGAGKTVPALHVTRELLRTRSIGRVVVVCPTAPLTRQWAAAAARMGLPLAPDAANRRPPAGHVRALRRGPAVAGGRGDDRGLVRRRRRLA